MDYNTLFNLFDRKHQNINDTSFYFKTDPNLTEHFIGYSPGNSFPYWVGYCDIENGWSCKTAKELFEAPVFDGKSIKDRWDEIVLIQIGAIGIDEWNIDFCTPDC